MPNRIRGELEVVFEGYSDDGLHVLESFERLRILSLILLGAQYEADLVLGGEREGAMQGSLSYDFVNDVNLGVLTSELDGRTLEGPSSCEEAGLLPLP